jgi:hypothetical protein
MSSNRRILALCLGLSIVAIQVGSAAAATSRSDGDLTRNGTYRSSLPLDARTCQLFGQKAGCAVPVVTIVSDQVGAASSAPAQVGALAATSCKKMYSYLNFSAFGGLYGQDAYIHVPMCWNGSTIWHGGPEGAWGPDCWIKNLALGYAWGTTWCGMVANNTDHTQAGHNWNIWPFIVPFAKTAFWARMNFRPNGTFYWTGGRA